jgi:hypothetical protein
MSLPIDGQQFKNLIKEANMAFGSVPAAYGTLIDLGSNNMYDHIDIISTLDDEVTLKFAADNEGNQNELIIPAGDSTVYDNFVHNGIVQIKYNSSAPTSGAFKLRSW